MAQIIDITSRITNELPIIRITQELVVTVNNRKNTILNMQAMIQKIQDKSKDGTYDELALMNKVLEMLLGEKAAGEVEELNLPLPEYRILYQAIMAAATGTEVEDVEKRFQDGEARG